MRAWYDIRGLDRTAVEDEAGFRAADTAISELIARQVALGIAPRRIVLAGFSQGGAVALYVAPRHPERLAGVVALSTYLPLAGRLATERLGSNDATPIFMAHGLADPVLPFSMGRDSRDALLAAGFSVEWHQYPMAHSVSPAELADLRSFLLRVLP
jgi:phospholipase/carboxylesterase